MKSLYGLYIKERTDSDILESEDGFISYKLYKDKKQLFIEDCFIHPDKRHTGVARQFFDNLSSVAKDNDCEYLACTTDMNTNGWHKATENLVKYGFSVVNYDPKEKVIFLIKELYNG